MPHIDAASSQISQTIYLLSYICPWQAAISSLACCILDPLRSVASLGESLSLYIIPIVWICPSRSSVAQDFRSRKFTRAINSVRLNRCMNWRSWPLPITIVMRIGIGGRPRVGMNSGPVGTCWTHLGSLGLMARMVIAAPEYWPCYERSKKRDT